MGVKLKHASGNGTVIGAPAANPSADITLKAPSTTGSAGQVLKVASANHSSTNAELEWAAASGGKILQVVSSNLTTQMTSSSDSAYVDTGLTASITPSATGSKVLVIVNVSFALNGDNNAFLRLLRGSTVINSGAGGTENAWTAINANATAFRYSAAQQACNYLDSPSTTSATTYKVQTKVANGSTTLSINRRPDDTEFGTSSNITLMEVAA